MKYCTRRRRRPCGSTRQFRRNWSESSTKPLRGSRGSLPVREELLVDLKRLKRDSDSGKVTSQTGRQPPRQRIRKSVWVPALSIAAIVIAALMLYWRSPGLFRRTGSPLPISHKQVTFVGDATYPAISPDGSFAVYVRGKNSEQQKLMLHDIRNGQTIELLRAYMITRPKWSPDSSNILLIEGKP